MAAALTYVIDVDDRGEATIRKFDETAKRSFSNAQKGASGFLATFSKIGKVALVAGGLIAGALGGLGLGKAIADTVSFNKQFSGVVSLFGSAERAASAFGRPLGLVKEQLEDMSGFLGTTTELARVLYQVISSGTKPAQAMAVVKASAELAAAGMADAEESAKLLTTVLNAFPGVAGGAAGAADILFNTVKLGKVEVNDLATGFGNILPAAQLLGVSLEETSAAVAALSLTQPAAIAMTNLQNAFTAIAKEADDFKKAGIDVLAILQGPRGFQGVIEELRARFGDNPLGLRAIIKDQQAIAGLVPLITGQFKDFNAALASNRTETGQVSEANRILRMSYDGMVKELRGKIEVAFQRVAEVVLRELTPAILALTDRISAFSKSGEFAGWLRSAGETLGALVTAIKTVASAADSFRGTLDSLGVSVGSLIGPVNLVYGPLDLLRRLIGLLAGDSQLTFGEIIPAVIRAAGETFEWLLLRAKQGILAFIAVATELGSIIAKALVTPIQAALDTVAGVFDQFAQKGVPGFAKLSAAATEASRIAGQAPRLLQELSAEAGKQMLDVEDRINNIGAVSGAAGDKVEVMGTQAAETSKEMGRLGGDTTAAAEAAKKLQDAIDGFLKSAGYLSQADFDFQVRAIEQARLEMERAGASQETITARLGDSYVRLAQTANDYHLKTTEAFSKQFLAATRVKAQFEEVDLKIEEVTFTSEEMGPVVERAFNRADQALDEFKITLTEAIAAGVEGQTTFSGLFSGLLGSLKSLGGGALSSLSKGGGILGQLFGNKESGLGKFFANGGVGGFVTGKIKDLAGSLGGKLGGLLGGAAGPLGSLAGSFIAPLAGKVLGGLKKLFGGTPEHEKLAKGVSKSLGVNISTELAKELAKSGKSVGGRGNAVTIGLSKIIQEVGIKSPEAFSKFSGEALKAFDIIKAGGKGATEAAASLNDTYGALIQSAQELGVTGSLQFRQLIRAAKESGQALPESLLAFLKGGVGEAAGAFGTLLEKSGTKGLSSLGVLAGDISAAARTAGISTRDLVAQLGPGLDAIAAKARAAGEALPEGLAGLIGDRNFAVKNADLLDAVDALTTVTQKLGETDSFTAAGFGAAQEQAVLLAQQLTAAGADQTRVLTALGPTLQQIVNEHLRSGQAIDAETQALIDQASAMGVVKAEGTGLINTLQTGFDGIIAALGGTPVFQQLADKAALAANQVAGATRSAVDRSLGDLRRLSGAFGNVGGTVGLIREAGKGGGGPRMPSHAEGIDFVPRTGPALIHRGERIIPADENARGSRGGGTAHLSINLDMGDLGRRVVKVMLQAARDGTFYIREAEVQPG